MKSGIGNFLAGHAAFLLAIAVGLSSTPARGPLRVCEVNPRYFCDDQDQVVYLTGAHTWANLVDMGPSEAVGQFDFDKYLDWMESYHHNFVRLWTWELLSWNTQGNRENKLHTVGPLPWARTGPGKALDGNPKFDLTQFNNEYLGRLRQRANTARWRGFYVSIMLFEGWGLQFSPGAWESHPFHPANNINGIDGDLNGDGKGLEIHTLANREITALQEAYVKKVLTAVNDLDNVLFEISNENHPPSTEWQYHMIDFIHRVEKDLSRQHAVGMTFQYKGGENAVLFESPAEWISPNHEGGYREDPPAADGKKVVLLDTDHLWGIGGNKGWVWKSFLRGHNPLFMDPYDGVVLGKPFDTQWEAIRVSLGHTRRWAERVDLTALVPKGELASSGYCLARPGREYLVYLPEGGRANVDLSTLDGIASTEWFDPGTGVSVEGPIVRGGGVVSLNPTFEAGDMLLYICATN
jgi:hypothetical protein